MRLVTVVPYNNQWPEIFEFENSLLLMTLGRVISKEVAIKWSAAPDMTPQTVL
ncbi:GrpB family protein, partial [Klebsiella pneumoniae]